MKPSGVHQPLAESARSPAAVRTLTNRPMRTTRKENRLSILSPGEGSDKPKGRLKPRGAPLARCLLAGGLVAACLALGVVVSAAAGLTPKDVARIRTVFEVKISPDGRHIAYTLTVPRRPFDDKDGPAWRDLHVVDREGHSRPFVTGKVNVSVVRWTPDGHSISFLAKRGDDKDSSLYVIPIDGGEARKVFGHDTSMRSYVWSPDGKQVAFTAVKKTDKDKKKLRDQGFNQVVFEEDPNPVRVWIIEPDLSPDAEAEKPEARMLELEGSVSTVAWSSMGDRLAVATAPTPAVDDQFMNRSIQIVDPENGELHAKIEPPGKMGPFIWSPDGKTLALLVAEDRSDPDPGRLAVVSPSGGELQYLLTDLDGRFSALRWRDADTIIYVADRGVVSTVGQIGREGAGFREQISREAGIVLGGLDRAEDGTIVTRLQSARHPAEVAVFAPGETKPTRLTHSNPWLDEVDFAPQEVISYKARDGLELQGILIRPLGEEPGQRYPLIVMVHGGPESHISNGWLSTYSRLGQTAAARGMAIFYPNYRGSTGRTVAFSKLHHGDPAGKEFDDLVDAVDHLKKQGLIDPKRVGITGGSYGGYATAWGSTYYSERFAAGVMFVGISDLVSKAGTTDIPEEIFLVHHRKRVWDEWRFFRERSPIYHIDKARTPLLILHGRNDARVPPSQSMQLYRLLKAQGKTAVRLILYPGEGHGNRRAASRYDYHLRTLRWMEHYLKGPGGDVPPLKIDYGQEKDDNDKKEEEKAEEQAAEE